MPFLAFFQGAQTPLTLANYLGMLALLAGWAGLTGWPLLFVLRALVAPLDRVGHGFTRVQGGAGLFLLVAGSILCWASETTLGLVVLLGPFVLLLSLFNRALAVVLPLLLIGAFLLVEAALYAWFAELTGIGWPGFVAYVILTVELWQLAPPPR
ncbi:hypothetical protein [Hymenobacter jejuensis]|nr:hypothetical protein [Hymenobacter jejuensis]